MVDISDGEVLTGPHLFDLTPITGRKRRDSRQIVVAKAFDVNLKAAISTGLSLVSALPVLLIAFPLVGGMALLVYGVAVAAVFWLFFRNSTKGLRTTSFAALRSQRTARNRRFYQGMTELSPDRFQPVTVVFRTRPVDPVARMERILDE